ncbi:MAG: bifunctional phosphopantothenoylcysteine decarboxylase/phosphopantothenate--cysteine ligase CoaBC [Bacteroidetes bacterium]|nr:bifunctional phosphopantothenoylcysteine decarboxylase/phosphopantothenate--cysteine ligase CoaBC [Bacteroidota bacterium]
MLRHKHIVLAVTGGIAAYKAASLVRLFVKEGAEVRVIMTKSAEDFVTAKTLGVLSKHEVVTGFFDAGDNWNNHVHLAEWADMIVVAPLTANTMAKFANGLCDNIVCACYLSARSVVFAAPAMDLDMYRHPTTIENIAKLEKQGTVIIPAERGELASGLSGEGRMAEPEHIVEFIKAHLSKGLPLSGKRVLVNAGPTYEAIDPVRFIGNRSSGKMGVALADAFAEAGAEVYLVLGPSNCSPLHKSVSVQHVESAQDMLEACTAHFSRVDIAVLSAAVADYKPKTVAGQKIKKKDSTLNLELIKTADVLKTLGETKKHQVLIGFALETENVEEYAREKLKSKNLDMIVANSATEAGTGFGVDTNRVTIIDKHNNLYKFELKTKQEIARDIVKATLDYMMHGEKNMNDPA